MHFVIDPATLAQRGIVGLPNGIAHCFIVSGLQLLLHAAPFRTFLHRLANQTPPITNASPLLEDFVHLFNKVWGDGWPNPPPPPNTFPQVRIHTRLYHSLVNGNLGVVNRQAGNANDFLRAFLDRLKGEIDGLVPAGQFDALFSSTIQFTAPHQGQNFFGINHLAMNESRWLMLSLLPWVDPSTRFIPIETMIVRGCLSQGHGFHQCNHQPHCTYDIDRNRITGRFTHLPHILSFSLIALPGTIQPDPSPVITFIDGEIVPAGDQRANGPSLPNRVQYDLIGYVVYVGNHYMCIVKHPETNAWFQIDDDHVTPIIGPDPSRPGIVNPGFLITIIMYARRP